MDKQTILSHVDHTELDPAATWASIRQMCDDGLQYGVASVCIPPCYVEQAAGYLAGRLPVCTVVGFPHGNATTAAKCFEAAGATLEDVELFASMVDDGVLVKAAGGIRTFEQAEAMLKRGAARLGASALVRLMKEEEE